MNTDNVKNIIFDLDGTLVDSSRGIAKSANYALEKMNEPPRAINEIQRFIGYPLEDMCAAFTHKPFSDFWKYFRDKAREVMADSTVRIDGADNVICSLFNRGYNLAIGSTKITQHISGIARKFNWEKMIKVFVGADEVDHVKPAPDTFIKALQLLNGNPENTIVVGDTVNDILAARAISMPAVAVQSPYGRNDELLASKPDLVLDRVADLLKILK